MESERAIHRISDGTGRSVHAYYDICPESPDGTRVVYFRFEGDAPGTGDIVMHERRGGRHQVIGRSPRGTAQAGARQQWAGRERVLWSEVDESGPCVMVYDLPGNALHEFAGACDTFSPAQNRTLYHSNLLRQLGDEPDEEAVWSLQLGSGDVDTFITREQALAVHPEAEGLVPEHMKFQHAKWSPDGTQFFVVFTNILVARENPGEVPQVKSLMLADADGANLRYLWPCGGHPTWTADGRGIYAHEYGPLGPEPDTIWVGRTPEERGEPICVLRTPGGGDPVLLQRGPGCHSSLSPDGGRLVTDVMHPDDRGGADVELRLFDVPCESPDDYEVLVRFHMPDTSRATGAHAHPAWSPDGRRIYFDGTRNGTVQLYSLELDGSPADS